jgi:hypothetical protein
VPLEQVENGLLAPAVAGYLDVCSGLLTPRTGTWSHTMAGMVAARAITTALRAFLFRGTLLAMTIASGPKSVGDSEEGVVSSYQGVGSNL